MFYHANSTKITQQGWASECPVDVWHAIVQFSGHVKMSRTLGWLKTLRIMIHNINRAAHRVWWLSGQCEMSHTAFTPDIFRPCSSVIRRHTSATDWSAWRCAYFSCCKRSVMTSVRASQSIVSILASFFSQTHPRTCTLTQWFNLVCLGRLLLYITWYIVSRAVSDLFITINCCCCL